TPYEPHRNARPGTSPERGSGSVRICTPAPSPRSPSPSHDGAARRTTGSTAMSVIAIGSQERQIIVGHNGIVRHTSSLADPTDTNRPTTPPHASVPDQHRHQKSS